MQFSPPSHESPKTPNHFAHLWQSPKNTRKKRRILQKSLILGWSFFPKKHQNSAKKRRMEKERHSLCVMERNERTKKSSLAGRGLHKPIPAEPEQTTTAKAVTATPPLYEEATNNPLLQLVPLAVPPIPNQTKSLHMLNPVAPTHCTSPFSAQAPAPEG